MQWHMLIGYKVVNGRIIVYEEHRKIVEEIFRDYDSGISASRIAEGLRIQGVCNAHDRAAWTHCSIGRILENHNYLGTEYYPQIIQDRKRMRPPAETEEQVSAEYRRAERRLEEAKARRKQAGTGQKPCF